MEGEGSTLENNDNSFLSVALVRPQESIFGKYNLHLCLWVLCYSFPHMLFHLTSFAKFVEVIVLLRWTFCKTISVTCCWSYPEAVCMTCWIVCTMGSYNPGADSTFLTVRRASPLGGEADPIFCQFFQKRKRKRKTHTLGSLILSLGRLHCQSFKRKTFRENLLFSRCWLNIFELQWSENYSKNVFLGILIKSSQDFVGEGRWWGW